MASVSGALWHHPCPSSRSVVGFVMHNDEVILGCCNYYCGVGGENTMMHVAVMCSVNGDDESEKLHGQNPRIP